MKAAVFPLTALAALTLAAPCFGHDSVTGEEHPVYDHALTPPAFFLAQATTSTPARPSLNAPPPSPIRPAQAAAFTPFAPRVNVRWDERFLFVEGNGLPAHNMMVGITAWQQQVPLPQNYTGANAWQFPLLPVPAKTPLSIKGRFLRGAIAIAANGIPIFNPQNNRGEVSAEIGELDQWGGHCGRADDYHYHAAPLHLQSVLGPKLPIAYALDGYAIYGLTEPDGTAPAGLDSFNGHTTTALGYHYHASKKYPYVNGGFHGEVTEVQGQVDPQPRAQPVRQDTPPLRGATITAFERPAADSYKLSYEVAGDKRAIVYAVKADGTMPFEYQNGREGTTTETYTRRAGREGGGGPPRRELPQNPESRSERRGQPREAAPAPASESASVFGMDDLKKPNATFVLSSPEFTDGGNLPADETGDGSGATPPLAWKGAPIGTKSYALIMDHLAPGNEVKSYWVIADLPASVTSLAKNAKVAGRLGSSFKGVLGYEPPHSQGPGPKTYVLTVYALSSPPPLATAPGRLTRDSLLAAIKDKVLASASLKVVSARAAGATETTREPRKVGNREPARDERTSGFAPASPPPVANTDSRPSQPIAQKANPPRDGLIKASMTDTLKAEVYADNWFALYINGRLTVVDPIAFLPHNVVSVDLLPEYPMTIAIIAHDNADPKTGLEYGNHIGDAGLIVKFADGTVTDGTWKAKSIERGPLGGDISNPRVENEPRPEGWYLPDFDDRSWENARVFTEQEVNPKPPYYEHDFKGAQFIWSQDLALDNTVLFRKRIEKPGWTPRWTAVPAGPLPQP